MKYSKEEVTPLYEEDFTRPFKATIGSENASLDFLTFVHHTINFNEAYNKKEVIEIQKGIFIQFVSYDFLKDIKLKANRDKDYFDVARLEEIRSKK
jgi:hypothetical protein